MMTYDEARAYIAEASKKGSILGLASIEGLLQALAGLEGQDLTESVPVIHIAGTNGKGSVGAFLSAILQEAKLNVGRFTSPAVFSPLESWTINGENISEADYCQMVSRVKEACDMVKEQEIYPTYFEIETAMAFLYFSRKKVDVLLLEVGMGGETDATNVVKAPLCEVITSISRDHMGFLGNTLSEIAEVKAGIMKPNTKAFSSIQEMEVTQVLKRVAADRNTGLSFVEANALMEGKEEVGRYAFSYKGIAYETKLSGHYQMKNAALAIEVADYAISQLCSVSYGQDDKNGVDEKNELICTGIYKAVWPGRFEVLRQDPLFIMDGAHNEEAARELRKTVENCFTNKEITYIIGVLADKEHELMLKLMLPYAKKVYTVTPNNPRAMDGEALAEEARKYHADVTCCQSVEEAVALTKNQDTLAFGSLSYLGELRDCFK